MSDRRLSPKWSFRTTVALGFFAVTLATHAAIINIRAGRDWQASFQVALALFAAGILVRLVWDRER